MLHSENLITSLDQFRTAIYLKNSNGHYMSMNSAGIQLISGQKDYVLGRTAHDLFDFESATEMWESDQYCIYKKDIYATMFDAKDKETGKSMPIFTAKTPILAPSGQALGILGFSVVGYQDAQLYSELCQVLPQFLQTKKTAILNELLELQTVVEFYKYYHLH